MSLYEKIKSPLMKIQVKAVQVFYSVMSIPFFLEILTKCHIQHLVIHIFKHFIHVKPFLPNVHELSKINFLNYVEYC